MKMLNAIISSIWPYLPVGKVGKPTVSNSINKTKSKLFIYSFTSAPRPQDLFDSSSALLVALVKTLDSYSFSHTPFPVCQEDLQDLPLKYILNQLLLTISAATIGLSSLAWIIVPPNWSPILSFILSTAAWIILFIPKSDHVTPLFKNSDSPFHSE